MFHSPAHFARVVAGAGTWLGVAAPQANADPFQLYQQFHRFPAQLEAAITVAPHGPAVGCHGAVDRGVRPCPQDRKQTISESEGIAIELLVDRSGSMQAIDFQIDGEPVDRLTAIKNVAGKFVLGGSGLETRCSDLIGLITFAGRQTCHSTDARSSISGWSASASQNATGRSEEQRSATRLGLPSRSSRHLIKAKNARCKQGRDPAHRRREQRRRSRHPAASGGARATLGVKIYTIGVGTRPAPPR